MSTITQIRIWRDTGFTDGCTEVPKKGGSLASPTYIFDGPFNPSKDDLFSKLKLRVPYTHLMDCSYLSISLDMKNGTDKTFYGWIDSVSIISDTESTPMTQVNWHVDLWRTYLSSATIGSGMVRRRPLLSGDSVPPQPYPHRYYNFSSSRSIINSTDWWILMVFSYTTTINVGTEEQPSQETTTYTYTGAFPVDVSSPSTNLTVGSYKAPSLNQVISGGWDELLGLDPANIYAVFASPVAPMSSMNTGWVADSSGTKGYGMYKAAYLNNTTQYTATFQAATTNDTQTAYITGFDGEIIGAIPWGLTVASAKYRVIMDTTSAYIQVRFDGIQSHTEGLCFTIPLIPVSLSANAWSSYVYSGSRQADIDQSRLEAEKARESSLTGTGSSVVSSVASSAMLGSLGGPVGTLGGALIGGASSLISGTIGASTEYATATKYSDRFQEVTDYRAAHQSNGLIMAGSGFDCLRYGQKGISIMIVLADTYSTEQRANDLSLYGVHVSEPKTSCQSLIDAGGPVQIDNAVVTGSIPVEAKQYIRQRLAQGVRMI